MTRTQRTSTYTQSSDARARDAQCGQLAPQDASGRAPRNAAGQVPRTLVLEQRVAMQAALLTWYSARRRNLPWRLTRDPYCIWVSEIMLQQTRVQSVIGYYERWIRRFPSVHTLAAAESEDVLRAWEGLGYYSRARNLQRAAQQIVAEHGGSLPQRIDQLRALPGIGPYSAGAIASIAFDQDEPVVDGNVIRVLTRLFALAGNPRREPLAGLLWQLARELLPQGKASDFNQALMELGATVCLPRGARCAECPVAACCRALAEERVESLPEAPPRPALSEERHGAAIVRRDGRMLMIRAAPEAPRWAGMWQFPDTILAGGATAEQALPPAVAVSTGVGIVLEQRLCSLQHHVTRFRLEVEVFAARAVSGRARAPSAGAGELRWCAPEEISALAMPLYHRKIARAMLSDGQPTAQPAPPFRRTRPGYRMKRSSPPSLWRVAQIVIGSLLAVALLIVGLGALLPRSWQVQETILINAPPAAVHAWAADLERWPRWAQWNQSALWPQNRISNPSSGAGATLHWYGQSRRGDEAPAGEVRIVRSDPASGVWFENRTPSSALSESSVRYQERPGVTLVIWEDRGQLPPVIGGLFLDLFQQRLHSHMAGGLERLKDLVEGDHSAGQVPPTLPE